MEMRCYRKILRISYKDHATNEEVRAKIQQAIGPHEELLTIVKRRKLQWYGHVSRSSGLAKTILQGTVKGGRRQGGRRKRWEYNIEEWTGLEFGKSQRAVENRGEWRKLVAKSSVVPQRPPAVKGSMMMMMMNRRHEQQIGDLERVHDSTSLPLYWPRVTTWGGVCVCVRTCVCVCVRASVCVCVCVCVCV